MNVLLTCNLSDKTVLDGTAPWTPPVFTFGESLTIGLRLVENALGSTIPSLKTVNGLSAAIGFVDAPPNSGTWALKVGAGPQSGSNTTAPVQYNCTPAALALALNALSAEVGIYGAFTVKQFGGSYFIRGANGIQVPLLVVDNELFPVSFGRVTMAVVDAVWVTELRLFQLPVAFTDASDRVLTPAPVVTEVTHGGSDGSFRWNEVQALYVRPDFAALFTLKKGTGGPTAKLSVADTSATIQAALEAVYGAGNFSVTDGQAGQALIEFQGDFAGAPFDPLTVTALNPPLGNLTFTLTLDRYEMLSRLRLVPAVQLPIEVRLTVTNDDETTSELVVMRQDVIIQRPLIIPDLALVPGIDWLRPRSPKDYEPFDPTTVITGQQFYRAVVGDGAATAFVIAHGLATDDVFVFARQNTSTGRQLVDGTDFSVVLDDANSVTVTALTGAPALNAWAATVLSAQTVAAFATGLHIDIAQVNGLETRLEALEAAVAALQALVPTTPLGSPTAGAPMATTIQIPQLIKVFPGKGSALLPPSPLGGLLPAIHNATVTSLTALPLPSVSAALGNVYSNDTGAPLLIPGGLGTRSSYVAVSGFFGGDGRRLYPLTHVTSTTSYFPRDFEVSLWNFEVNAQMFRANSTLQVNLTLMLQLLLPTSRAQYLFIIEHGLAPSQASPATTAPNLQDIVWNATPLLTQRVILSEDKIGHLFGVTIINSALGVLSANKSIYGKDFAADSVPASADLALRARLISFDTENSVVGAKGAISIDTGTIAAQITYAS